MDLVRIVYYKVSPTSEVKKGIRVGDGGICRIGATGVEEVEPKVHSSQDVPEEGCFMVDPTEIEWMVS